MAEHIDRRGHRIRVAHQEQRVLMSMTILSSGSMVCPA